MEADAHTRGVSYRQLFICHSDPAKAGEGILFLDCRVACAPRNDQIRKRRDWTLEALYYRGLRRPLCLQSRQSLPFMLAVLAYGFPLKDASHAEDHAFKHG